MAKIPAGKVLISAQNVKYKVEKFIKAGSQGAVYKVSAGNKIYALKWYTKGGQDLENHFRFLVQKGIPKNSDSKPDTRFVWPQDLIKDGSCFGYIMDFVDHSKYVTLFRALNKPGCYPKIKVLSKICINLAEAFDDLHKMGFCYKDISHNNILFNKDTGDVLIVDNDNVVVNGQQGAILGTPKFMAPEVVVGKAGPNRETDKFSLASYFFYLIVGHNPFEGKVRDDYALKNNGVIDDAGFKEIFGTKAVFCFNPTDKRNALTTAEYSKIVERWENIVPDRLKDKFMKTFVTGLPLEKATERTTDKEWTILFNKIGFQPVKCSCGEEYFAGAKRCIKCGNILSADSYSVHSKNTSVTNSNGVNITIMEKGVSQKKLYTVRENTIIRGGELGASLKQCPQLAQVLKNSKTGTLGLKNMTALQWYYKDANASNLEVIPSGRIVSLKKGRTIAFIRGQIQIIVQ